MQYSTHTHTKAGTLLWLAPNNTRIPAYTHTGLTVPYCLRRRTGLYLAGTVQAALESWLAKVVSLQLALDDVGRVDAQPINRPCCTSSQHQWGLTQFISTLQALTPATEMLSILRTARQPSAGDEQRQTRFCISTTPDASDACDYVTKEVDGLMQYQHN